MAKEYLRVTRKQFERIARLQFFVKRFNDEQKKDLRSSLHEYLYEIESECCELPKGQRDPCDYCIGYRLSCGLGHLCSDVDVCNHWLNVTYLLDTRHLKII